MLVVVMHNNQEYLEYLKGLALKEGIKDATVIKQSGIGTRLIGGTSDFVFTRGSMRGVYDKAFVAAVKGEEKTKRFLALIDADSYLGQLNMQNRGFLCALPFHYIKNFELEAPPAENKEGKTQVSGLLKEGRILLSLDAGNKKDALTELAAVLGGAEEVVDFNLFLKDILGREALSTTAIGSETAVPHARSGGVKKLVLAFARVAGGVDFGAPDNKAVKLIFLIGTPKESGTEDYLRILARLTGFLQKESLRRALIQASSAKEIIAEFRKAEEA